MPRNITLQLLQRADEIRAERRKRRHPTSIRGPAFHSIPLSEEIERVHDTDRPVRVLKPHCTRLLAPVNAKDI